MYYIEHENKIVLVDEDKTRLENTLDFMPQYADKEILETEQEIENFMFVGSDEWIEWKSEEVRSKRNAMLVQEIDPIVGNPLRWADLTEEEQQEIKDYRIYLLNIPEAPDFPDTYIMTFEEWKSAKETDKEDLSVDNVSENYFGDIETTSEKLKLD